MTSQGEPPGSPRASQQMMSFTPIRRIRDVNDNFIVQLAWRIEVAFASARTRAHTTLRAVVVPNGVTIAIMTVYVDISGCLQPGESAACGNFRSAARATNYCWHRADYSSRCSHPRQIVRDRAPRRRHVNVVHCWQRREFIRFASDDPESCSRTSLRRIPRLASESEDIMSEFANALISECIILTGRSSGTLCFVIALLWRPCKRMYE